MHMPKFVVKWLRQRKIDQIIRVGEQRREVMIARSKLERNEWTAPDCDYLDAEIERLSRKRDRLIDYLKTTPAY